MYKATAALLLFAATPCYAGDLQRIFLTDEKARCLDGTPYAVYFRPAFAGSQHPKEWVIDLAGGGACLTKASCLSRSHTKLGSSANYNATTSDFTGVLNNDTALNPFADFNHIYMPYCTGDAHTGQRTEANEWGLYFAGHLNLRAVVDYFSTHHGMNSSDQSVLLTGESAGGIGTFNNADLLQAMLPSVRVRAMPDAGWYFANDTHTYVEWKSGEDVPYSLAFTELSVNLWQAAMNPHCTAMQLVKNRCFDASVNYKYVDVPILVLENMYDKQQMNGELLCPGNCFKDYISQFGKWMLADMENQVISDPRTGNGLYMPSCFSHTLDLCMAHPMTVEGVNVSTVARSWYFEGNAMRVYDKCSDTSPCNTMCGALSCPDVKP